MFSSLAWIPIFTFFWMMIKHLHYCYPNLYYHYYCFTSSLILFRTLIISAYFQWQKWFKSQNVQLFKNFYASTFFYFYPFKASTFSKKILPLKCMEFSNPLKNLLNFKLQLLQHAFCACMISPTLNFSCSSLHKRTMWLSNQDAL